MSDDTVAVEASRLLRDPRVHARIEELRTSLQRSLGVSRATLLREIDEVRELAKTSGDVKTVLTATMSKARLLGFLDSPPSRPARASARPPACSVPNSSAKASDPSDPAGRLRRVPLMKTPFADDNG